MAFVVDVDVDGFGVLDGPEFDHGPLHDWYTPHPGIAEPIDFTWLSGSRTRKPNVFSHVWLRDLVVDPVALDVLLDVCPPGDVHVVGAGLLDGVRWTVVQATAMLDVVDVGRSLPSDYAPHGIGWPHIPETETATRNRFFRVPNPGLYTTVLVGAAVKEAWEKAGLRGWHLEPAIVHED